MNNWSLLPGGIRLDIFSILAEDTNGNVGRTWTKARTPDRTKTPNKKTGLSRYAAVCNEWHVFFQKRLFRRLTLTQWCLDDFEKIVVRQRGLVQHIWLRIELSRYSCLTCKEFWREPLEKRDSNRAKDAITQLFSILSSWETSRDAYSQGLTLELSAYSPSDLEHAFQGDVYLDSELHPIEDIEVEGPHDPAHRWFNGQRSEPPDMPEIAKVFAIGVSPVFEEALPTVEAVRRLLIRRLTRWFLATQQMHRIVESLPKLDSIIYEPWRDFIHPEKYFRDPHYQDLISKSLPESLKSLTIFEDFNETHNEVYSTHWIANEWPWPPELVRTPHPPIGWALARRSIGLERVSASYLMDAVDFFKACKADWIWNKLRLLALTSPLFRDKSNWKQINRLLVDAGTAALRMPHLQRLELWHGSKRHAAVFRYQVAKATATISWHGTWELPMLDLDVLHIWRGVAGLDDRRKFSVCWTNEMLAEGAITSHAAAIRELGLSDQVIHPASLEEIWRESKWYFRR